jgi:hypothetical protein
MMTYLHSLLRWAIIILGIITLIRSLRGMNGTRAFLPADKKSALFLMIACDLQLLAGLYLYFTSAWGLKNIQSQGMGAVMKDAASRFFAVEHSLGMLVALLLVHLGYRAVKKDMPDTGKFKKLFWFTLLAFIIIMATIPWPFRAGIARPWLFGLSA